MVGLMPKKVRELKSALQKAGFSCRSGKGSHTVWFHPLLPDCRVVISGKDGADADRYHEKDVRDALKELEQIKRENNDEPSL
jgi:predicted RNA binding protein YcfA (HicA-like mRNA interferase family)